MFQVNPALFAAITAVVAFVGYLAARWSGAHPVLMVWSTAAVLRVLIGPARNQTCVPNIDHPIGPASSLPLSSLCFTPAVPDGAVGALDRLGVAEWIADP